MTSLCNYSMADIYIEPLDDTALEKYRKFKPGLYETGPHVSDQWTNRTTFGTKYQNTVDSTTDISIYLISSELEDRLKHINLQRNPRQKTNREFGSHIQGIPIMFDSGSASEGASVSDPKIQVISDLDWMVKLGIIPNCCEKDVVENIPNKPGFVWINCSKIPEEWNKCINERESLLVLKGKNEYLSALAVHNFEILKESETFIKVKEKHSDGKMTPAVKYKQIINPGNLREGDENKTVYNRTFDSEGRSRDIDVVNCIAVTGWPEVAKGWTRRAVRRYGEHQTLEIMKSGYHLVTKTSPNGNSELDWRISFSVAEGKLIENWTETQHKCYFILKTMLKDKMTTPVETLSSYHLKTVMFWAVERLTDSTWDQIPLACCVLGIIDELIHALLTGDLPHYFIEESNLLEEFEFVGTHQAAINLLKLRFQPLSVLPKITGGEQNITRFDLMWYFAYMHYDEQIEFALNRNDLENVIKKWSRFIIYVAVLTLEDQKLGHITVEEVKIREVLLNAIFLVMQEVIKSANSDLNEVPFAVAGQSVLETQVENLKSEVSLDSYHMIKYNFYEGRFKMRLAHLQTEFCQELQRSHNKVNQNPNKLMETYLSNFTNGDFMKGIFVQSEQSSPCSEKWMDISELSKRTTALFDLDP